MSESPELPPRPAPPRRLGDTVAAWLAWFGVGRLIVSAMSVVVVALGVAWLVRAPAAPTESALPFTDGSVVPSTLPPPSTTPRVDVAGPTVPARSVVHVAGEVARPGVYELSGGDRVHDAIVAAGGATEAGDLNGLNLAAPVSDGMRVYVPGEGEIDPATVPSGAATSVAAGEPDDSAPTGPIDLNTADALQLESLPGIGPATAGAIVDDRERNGPFASVDDLLRVPGIGPAKLAAVADLVTA